MVTSSLDHLDPRGKKPLSMLGGPRAGLDVSEEIKILCRFRESNLVSSSPQHMSICIQTGATRPPVLRNLCAIAIRFFYLPETKVLAVLYKRKQVLLLLAWTEKF